MKSTKKLNQKRIKDQKPRTNLNYNKMSPRANQHQRKNIADLMDQKREKVKKRVRTSKGYLKKMEFQIVKIVKN